MIDSRVPGFVTLPVTAISGRMMSSFGSDHGPVPCVLAAHLMPAMRGLGSAVYVLGAVGPSDSSFPFWPLGGLLVQEESMQILRAVDDNHYNFESEGAPVVLDTFEHEIDDVHSLINVTMRFASDRLELTPWDTASVSDAIEASEGWDYFDEFMALPIQEFPND